MSNFNINWLAENFNQKSLVIFDIGCADLNDTVRMKNILTTSVFYAFECAEAWENSNMIKANQYNRNYIHKAVSDIDGEITFYPSLELDKET